ncbi:hypothetical protein AAF712_006839 [Marasmius tenuissimus]|uniref:CRAL-TRIO domain-containing protein n=1 Tax=Marasmius tenuissimus TaxID=585030 RepID=A0ABR2ZYK3_9AGAR
MGDTTSTQVVEDSQQGHSGHLTAAQEKSLEEFKQSLQKEGLYNPGEESTVPSRDDATLLRFLRARKFDVKGALKQYSDTQRWRKKHDVDNLFTTFPVDEFEDTRRFYPRWTGRRDKVTFGAMWALRNHLQEASKLATANYPETLHTIVVVNSPSFFPTIWRWISVSFLALEAIDSVKESLTSRPLTQGWFDEGTRKKIHVLGLDPGSVLRELINPADLPKTYGGELEWKYEDDPNLDSETKKVIECMPKGPYTFVNGKAQALSETATSTQSDS